MDANDFGGMIPVCVGSLKTGGRERLFGETVPEVATWDHQTKQLHIKLGNLAFVTREQAKEMGEKAERVRKEQNRRQLELAVSQLRGAHAAMLPQVAHAEKVVVAQRQAAEDALTVLKKAEDALREFDGILAPQETPPAIPLTTGEKIVNGIPVPTIEQVKAAGYVEPGVAEEIVARQQALADAMPQAPQPVVVMVEPKAAPTPEDIEAEKAKSKAAAIVRLATVISEVPAPEVAAIEASYSKLNYKDLEKVGKEMKVARPNMPKKVLLAAVLDRAKALRIAELQRQLTEKAASDAQEILDSDKPE